MSLMAILRDQGRRTYSKACIVCLVVQRSRQNVLFDLKVDVPRGEHDLLELGMRVYWYLLLGIN